MREVTKWDYRYLSLAKHVAGWSKDPEKKVGAVITLNNRILSTGFNGFSSKVKDTPERLNNRLLKLQLTIHAEINAMDFAGQPLNGATIYTWPCMPCAPCAAVISQRGIVECVAPYHNTVNWKESFELAVTEFEEAEIKLILVDEELVL